MAYLHDYQLDLSLNFLIGSMLRYFEEFTTQNGRFAGRLGRRGEVETRK
jgi:hypothetical protein